MNVDLSVIQNLNFECLKGCGLCCAFRPQIADHEEKILRTDPQLGPNIVDEFTDRFEIEHFLRLNNDSGNHGACVFLDDKRTCGVYTKRPFKCRLFPFYLRFSDGIQVDIDLACPGLWAGNGKPATQLASITLKELCGLDQTSDGSANDNEAGIMVARLLPDASTRYNATIHDLKSNGLWTVLDVCRNVAMSLTNQLCQPDGLESLLVNIGRNPFIKGYESLKVPRNPDYGLVESLSSHLIESSFEDKIRPVDHPLFLDESYTWQFLSLDNKIEKKTLVISKFNHLGHVIEYARKDYIKPILSPLSADARSLLAWYIEILNRRQSTYDFALLSTSENKTGNVLGSYMYAMALFIIEAWSWAAVYSRLNDISLNSTAMMKGIQAVDNSRVTGPAFDVI